MPPRPLPCDPGRLQRLLEDGLSELEQAELEAHVEQCRECRARMEELAAASGLWCDLRLLRPHLEATIDAPCRGLSGPEDLIEDEAELDFLDPPPDGDCLGWLGPYQILEVVGRGGMGVVLKARDPALDRIVAIKVLAPALAASGSARRRFAREAKAAAAVVHEHVVAIHAVDATPAGLPYIVMQYIAGKSLQERLDRSGPAELREIVRIGMQAAQALAAAHAQGLIHRDIKPANILLENGVERVKITDFGLARAIDDATVTQSGFVAGTPSFMAPEQARGEGIDHRSDLFSLGSVLYALCTGRAPFRRPSAVATLKCVCEETPVPIRELNPDIPPWLVRIVDRLHAKDPAARFESAAEVASLMERCLAHTQQPESVPLPAELADPPAPRHWRRWSVAAGLLLAAGLGIGLAGTKGVAQQVADLVATVLRIKTADGTLVIKSDDPGIKVRIDGEEIVITGAGPEEVRLKPGTHQVQALDKDGKAVRNEIITIQKGGKEVLAIHREPDTTPPAKEGWNPVLPREARRLQEQNRAAELQAQQAEIQKLRAELAVAEQRYQQLLRVSRTTDTPAVATQRRRLTELKDLLNVRERALTVVQLNPAEQDGPGLIWTLALSPDGKHIAIGQQGADGTSSALRVWDLEGHRQSESLLFGSPCRTIAYSSDGTFLAEGRFDGTVSLYHPSATRPIRVFEDQHAGVNQVVFTPDGKSLAVGYWNGTVVMWDITSGQKQRTFPFPEQVFSVAISPDGATLAVSGKDESVLVYDLKSGEKKATLSGHKDVVESLAFSPDGELLASASWDKTVKLWDASSGKLVATLEGHSNPVLCVRFAPDGKTLASSDGERDVRHYALAPSEIRVWDVARHAVRHHFRAHDNNTYTLVFTPDGKTLISGSMDKSVKVWDVETGRLKERIVPGGSYQPTGAVPAPPRAPIAEVTPRDVPATATRTLPVVVEATPAQDASVAQKERQIAELREQLARAEKELAEARNKARSPSDPAVIAREKDRDEWIKRMAALGYVSMSGTIKAKPELTPDQVKGLQPVPRLPGAERPPKALFKYDGKEARAVAYRPDGKTLAVGGSKGLLELRDVSDPASKPRALDADGNGITTLAFSPDGKVLATGGWDHRVVLRDADEGKVLATFDGHDDGVLDVAFSSDGEQLASASWDRTVRLCDVASKQTLKVFGRMDRPATSVWFAPKGKHLEPTNSLLIVGLGDWRKDEPGAVLLWDTDRGEEIGHLDRPPRDVKDLAVSADGAHLAVAIAASREPANDGRVELWDLGLRSRLATFPAPTGAIAVALSPDGTLLAWGEWDGTIELRAVTGHRSLARFKAHSDMIFGLAFAPDGRTLASASKDGMVKLWEVPQRTAAARDTGPVPDPRTPQPSVYGGPIGLTR
jgi:WD40 repeat protein